MDVGGRVTQGAVTELDHVKSDRLLVQQWSGFSFKWKNAAEFTAFAGLTLDCQLCIVAVEYMFDYGQPETGSARSAVAVITDTVEPLGDAGYIAMWNADAGICDA